MLPNKAYREIYRIRQVELRIAAEYPKDEIRCPVHLSLGQEWVAVGVRAGLTNQDRVFPTYRCHAVYLAWGGRLQGMVAELYGLEDGICGGYGGSMHLHDQMRGVMGASAIVGTTLPLAMGLAWTHKYHKRDAVTVAIIGEGATEEGSFWECLNFASIHKLPLLIVVENNETAIYTGLEDRACSPLWDRTAEWAPSRFIGEGRVFDLEMAVADCRRMVVDGEGPCVVEVGCTRWCDHVGVGPNPVLTDEWLTESQARDPLCTLPECFMDDLEQWDKVKQEVDEEINAAWTAARSAPDREEATA